MKQYYLPGTISLIFLPMLSLLYLQHRGVFEVKSIIKIHSAPNEAFKNKGRCVQFWKLPNLKDDEYVISDTPTQANTSLEKAHSVLHQIVETRDTIHGLVFKFDTHSTYGMFVEALNICLKEKANYWITPERNIWAYYLPPIDRSNSIVPILFCSVENLEIQPKATKMVDWHLFLWGYVPVWILFGGLCVLGICFRRNHY
jgi:hypothetical protein